MMKLLRIFLVGSLAVACTPIPKATGTLRGHVTIGPLVPVVRVGEPDPTPAPEVYAARQIVIYKTNGKTEVARAEIDAQGNYEISLPVGTYIVDINRIGIDSAAGLPTEVDIFADQVTVLDVDIDTGIR
jgi:hypothetical protein